VPTTDEQPIDWPALGLKLKAKRVECGWRQADVAEKLGVNRQTVGAIESGDSGVAAGTVLAYARLVGHALTYALPTVAPESETDRVS